MIVVIADDLSGAAELAGVARGCGLRAEVHMDFNSDSDADLVALDTDSRSLKPDEAAARLREITATVTAAAPDWIYKKTDSVLRGNILPEIAAVCEVAGKARSLLIPANPGKRRVIMQGHYGVDGVAIDRTAFADDPEYPATTSRVDDLLRRSGGEVTLLDRVEPIGDRGIHVPDAWEAGHLTERARSLADDTLPAGGVEFFEAVLKRHRHRVRDLLADPSPRSELKLFVCGSHAAWASSRRSECARNAVPVVPMPRRLFEDDFLAAEIDQWAGETVAAFGISNRVMLAIGGEKVAGIDPAKYPGRLAEAVGRVVKLATIGNMYLEGGATAAAVMRHLGWSRLRVLDPVAFGLATMEVFDRPAPLLTIKSGSYPWPDSVWDDQPM
jgi:D-threonate/D-erythronate kinase